MARVSYGRLIKLGEQRFRQKVMSAGLYDAREAFDPACPSNLQSALIPHGMRSGSVACDVPNTRQ